MKESAFEISAEWLWLFSRAQVSEISSKEDFQSTVMESESFHIVLFMDGETCGLCRSAKTNALRLSAGLMGTGADATVSFLNCGRDTTLRSFCTQDVGIEGHGYAPQVRGYSAGDKESLSVDFAGELLYNANEVPPHAALRMIESIVRLSSKLEETEGGLARGGGGKKGVYDEGEKDEDDEQPPPPNYEGGARRRPDFKGPKLNWNGPSARQALNGGGGGGGGHRSNPMLGH